MEWKYTIVGQEVRIDKVEEPESLVVIPEELGGLPVTELGAYVLAHSCVEEIHLPSRLHKIGAYGFYGCEKLRKIYCYGRILDLGAGLFADVANVEFLDITLFEGERSCFQEILSELRQTLRVRVHMPDGREARLIFPEYYEESVENTPARILFIETHGCGHRYRYCFVKREFQYRSYDEIFPHMKVQESESLVTELAIGRLQYPLGLTEKYYLMYEDYIKEHWRMAGQLLIEADSLRVDQVTNLESGGTAWLVEKLLCKDVPFMEVGIGGAQSEKQLMMKNQIAELVDMAQKAGDIEVVSWLMDFQHRKLGGAEQLGVIERDETGAVPRRRKRKFEL